MKKPTPEEVRQLREAYPLGMPRFDYREMILTVGRADDLDADMVAAARACAEACRACADTCDACVATGCDHCKAAAEACATACRSCADSCDGAADGSVSMSDCIAACNACVAACASCATTCAACPYGYEECQACPEACNNCSAVCTSCITACTEAMEPAEDDMRAGAKKKAAKKGKRAAEAEDPITIAISSEQPVLRYDWWTDEMYYEVLDHSRDAVDLSYARDGLPFVMSHRAYDGDQQHGLVENVRVEKDRRLRGELRMSRAQRSQEIAMDIRDGIRKKVSVGYIVGEDYEQVAGKGADAIPTRRYKNWMPVEASTVPIPADYTVGTGRALSASGQAALARFLELHPAAHRSRSTTTTAPKGQDGNMADSAKAPAGGTPDVTVVRAEGVQSERTRVTDITTLARTHKCEDKLAGWLESGKSADEVVREINGILSERLAKPVDTSRGIELGDKEYKRFSYARALLAGMDPREAGNVDTGFEREIIQEAKKRMGGISANKGGLVIPFVTPAGRANIDSATSTTGGVFKFTQPGDFIDALRNASSVMRAGARVIPGLTGPVSFPKRNAVATASWVTENPGSDMSRSNPTFTTVSLAFKTVQSAVAVSRQALFSAASGNYDLEALIRSDLAAVIALAIDLGALNGTGTSQPLGILQDTSVGTATALGTNGGTIAWTNIVGLEEAVGVANGVGRMAYLTNAKQRAQARRVSVLASTAAAIPIWQGSPAVADAGGGALPSGDGIVNGYPAYMSNQVPSNLTKGTATTVCSAWIFGAFEQVLIGMFGSGFEVLVDPYTLKLQNMVDITAWNFVDAANRYPTAFATIKDAL